MFLLPLHLDHVLGTTTTTSTTTPEGEKTKKVADLFASLDDRLRPMLLAVALEDRVMTWGERVPLLASMQHVLWGGGEVRVHAAVQANYDVAGAVYPKVFRYNTTIGSTGTDSERGGEQNYQPALTVDRGWYNMWERLVVGAVASLKESDDEIVKDEASRLQSMSNTSYAPATTMSTRPPTTSKLKHGDPVAAGYGLYPLQPRGLMFAPVVRGALDPLDKRPLQKLLTLEGEAAKEGPAGIEKKSRPTNSISEQDEKAEQIDVETTPKTFTWWTISGSEEVDGEHTGQVESTASAPAGRRPHPAVKSMALLLPLRFVMRRNVIANRSGSSDAAGAVDAMTSSVSEEELFQHFKDAILSKQVIAKLDSKLSEHGTSLYRLYQELPATFDFSKSLHISFPKQRSPQALVGNNKSATTSLVASC
eukprot:g18201.t1